MSTISKKLLQEAGIIPKLKLGRKIKNAKGNMEIKGNGLQKVKLIADKLTTGKDFKGIECEFVRYLFETETGEKRTYQTKKLNDKGELSYFVQGMADIEENQWLTLEMKRKGLKNYVEINPLSNTKEIEVNEDEIEEESETKETQTVQIE